MTAVTPAASQTPEGSLVYQVADEYKQRGYDVTLEPNLEDFPRALCRLRPDLLASRGDDHVAVVIKAASRALPLQPVPDVDALRAEGWRAELFFADDDRLPPIAPPDAVTERLREVAQLLDGQHQVAALLLVWAAVEEALRSLASRFAPHETSEKIVSPDQAYSMGLLSKDQLHLFSSLRDLRNQMAHNVAPAPISDSTIHDALELLGRMLSPTYLPPTIMADRVFAHLDPDRDVLEQVKRSFPEANPTEQSDAAEYIRPLQQSSARRVTVTLEDDLDGGPADETVRFSIDDAEYEINLNKKNAARLHKLLAPFIERARRARRPQPRGPRRTAASRQHRDEIRAWAKEQGLPVSERGRIPASVAKQYQTAANDEEQMHP